MHRPLPLSGLPQHECQSRARHRGLHVHLSHREWRQQRQLRQSADGLVVAHCARRSVSASALHPQQQRRPSCGCCIGSLVPQGSQRCVRWRIFSLQRSLYFDGYQWRRRWWCWWCWGDYCCWWRWTRSSAIILWRKLCTQPHDIIQCAQSCRWQRTVIPSAIRW